MPARLYITGPILELISTGRNSNPNYLPNTRDLNSLIRTGYWIHIDSSVTTRPSHSSLCLSPPVILPGRCIDIHVEKSRRCFPTSVRRQMNRFGWLRVASRSLFLQSDKFKGSELVRTGWRAEEIHYFCRAFSHLFQLNNYSSCAAQRNQNYFRPTFLSTNRAFHATARLEKDYYEILGVSKDSSQDEIKKAFHALAKKYHPDTNKNNEASKRKFQEIRNAYEVLRDPSKRAQYDQGSSEEKEELRYNETGGFNRKKYHDPFSGFHRNNRDPFSDNFYKIFSEVFENEGDIYADDIEVVLKLSFSEAAKGVIKQLSVNAKVFCDSCDGRGYSLNAKLYKCPKCHGVGRVTVFPFTTVCDYCRGSGKIIKDYCLLCKGEGVVDGTRTVNVQIPAGIDEGDVIKVHEAGNSGRKGINPGNLFINLQIEKDPVFERDGSDIYVDTKISLTQAILGGKIEVPTLSGKTKVTIPKGVKPGQLLVLRGKGLPKQARYLDYGDQYIRFRVNFPSSVNERQRAILEEFAIEESTKENDEYSEGNWWQQLIGRLTGPNLMLGLAFLLLINLILGK
ncbi:hypothetical protein LUZ60_001220 [Juncus effusus]|nr:hypothetical protein LUZ60_001220 [Juncus effusus]